jgi:hypothetical protein
VESPAKPVVWRGILAFRQILALVLPLPRRGGDATNGKMPTPPANLAFRRFGVAWWRCSKRNGHAQRASAPAVSQTSVLFGYARLDDATVSRSLFPPCLQTCKQILCKTKIEINLSSPNFGETNCRRTRGDYFEKQCAAVSSGEMTQSQDGVKSQLSSEMQCTRVHVCTFVG